MLAAEEAEAELEIAELFDDIGAAQLDELEAGADGEEAAAEETPAEEVAEEAAAEDEAASDDEDK